MNLIHRNIDVFGEQYPGLEKYAKNAQTCIDSGEYNLCMIYLGRIAETITRILCRRNNIPCDNDETGLVEELLKHGQITQNISRKINAITELHHDAANDAYNSPVSCKRIFETTVQLCEWFVSTQRFDFLKNLMLPEMPPDKTYPFLKLAELGRDVENNIYSLTRYGLLCLGNMGEEVCMRLTIRFIDMITQEKVNAFIEADDTGKKDMNLMLIKEELGKKNPAHREIAHRVRKLEQALRIKFLLHCGIIDEKQKEILQNMLAPRNGAVHGEAWIEGDIITYYTRNHDKRGMNARKLLDDTQSLCLWLFRKFISPGCILIGKVESEGKNNMRVSSGPVYGFVRNEDIIRGHECSVGKIYPFEVISVEGNRINLGMKWMSLNDRYMKYRNGQEVRVVITEIEEGHGVHVELREGQEDGVTAFIPSFGLNNMELSIGQEVNAKVNGFIKGRPYMFLTLNDVVQDNTEDVRADEPEEITEEEKLELQKKFLKLCMSGTEEEISRAISAGVRIHVRNRSQATGLMFAAQKNTARVVELLIDAGLDIDAQDIYGNTALVYAASYNTSDVVDVLMGKDADVNIINHTGHKAVNFAVKNDRLKDTYTLMKLKELTHN